MNPNYSGVASGVADADSLGDGVATLEEPEEVELSVSVLVFFSEAFSDGDAEDDAVELFLVVDGDDVAPVVPVFFVVEAAVVPVFFVVVVEPVADFLVVEAAFVDVTDSFL